MSARSQVMIVSDECLF